MSSGINMAIVARKWNVHSSKAVDSQSEVIEKFFQWGKETCPVQNREIVHQRYLCQLFI